MSSIVIDGLSEEDFRRSVQNKLRQGKASSTIKRLRELLTPYAGPGGVLPERFVTIDTADLVLTGWDRLGHEAKRHDRPGRLVSALSVAFGWPGEDVPEPDALGNLPPCIETSFFNDEVFPFSQSSREDLLDGYSYDGCTWAGDPISTDAIIGVQGIDDLSGVLALLEARLLASDEPADDDLRAGSLAACLLSALLTHAVSLQIERDGLPRPLCVTAGSCGVYPYFDTPVSGLSDAVLKVNEAAEEAVPDGQHVPGPRYSSLLVTGIPRAKKRAVLVLAESEAETAVRLAGLRSPQPDEIAAPLAPRFIEPFAPAPDLPELEPMPSDGTLLLAKKPAKHSADFRDMLSPRSDDLQQRLQSLVAVHMPPAVELAVPDAPVAEVAALLPVSDRDHEWPDEVTWLKSSYAPISSDEPVALVEDEEPALGLGGRMRAKVTGWINYFRW